MQNRRSFGSDMVSKRVLIALALSVLMHFLVLGFMHFDLGALKHEEDVVEVRFAHLVKPVPPEPLPQEPLLEEAPKPEVEPKPVEPEPEPKPILETEPIALPEQPIMQEQSVLGTSPEVPVLQEPQDNASEIVPPVPTVSDESAIETAIVDSGPEPFQYVETDFDILRGVDGYKIGQTKVTFQIRADQTYLLLSESEAKGFASLFLSGTLTQRSEGFVSERGLQPQEFIYKYGKNDKLQRAVFDWDNRKLTLETNKDISGRRLPKDTQDLVSFMYQFMFVPPLQEMQLNITNGKRLKAYGYSFIGEVELSTKMGSIRAMHLENINDDGDEKNEIWLAVDYRYLPVKIRKTEKDGSVIEQVVTNINTELLQ